MQTLDTPLRGILYRLFLIARRCAWTEGRNLHRCREYRVSCSRLYVIACGRLLAALV